MSARLREALELVLLFHGGKWTLEKEAHFLRVTGGPQVNPMVLDRHLREVLEEAGAASVVTALAGAELRALLKDVSHYLAMNVPIDRYGERDTAADSERQALRQRIATELGE